MSLAITSSESIFLKASNFFVIVFYVTLLYFQFIIVLINNSLQLIVFHLIWIKIYFLILLSYF